MHIPVAFDGFFGSSIGEEDGGPTVIVVETVLEFISEQTEIIGNLVHYSDSRHFLFSNLQDAASPLRPTHPA